MNERELARRCRQGDREAFRTLYETYSQHLMGVCMRYAGNADTAHDLLHDSFIKIFIAFGKFTYMGKDSLKAWMTKITVNTSLQFLKKSKEFYTEDNRTHEAKDDSLDFSDEGYPAIPDETLMVFIGKLPVGCRTVLNMYMFEDMSHREISKILGINEGASRVRLNRAKSLLAQKLKNYVEV